MKHARITRRAFALGAGSLAACHAGVARALLRSDAESPSGLPAHVEALITRMTLEEKAGQLTLMPSAWSEDTAAFNPQSPPQHFEAQYRDVCAGRLGGVFNGSGLEAARRLQEAAVEKSRLGIPLLFAADVIHGYRTVFPVPLAEAASFDPWLAQRTARVAATEAAAMGLDWTFAPVVDIARDARWGRAVEGSGEDVLLGMHMAAARVKGFQGSALSADDAVLACPKHLAAYGAAEGGLDYNTVDVSERTLREVYFPPFQAAFEAGALTTMAAFNELSGVPATANPWLIGQVLRREWGFGGFVVSDYTADRELIAHGFAADAREAARRAFLAGVDMSMASGLYLEHLPDLVRKGEVPLARLDQAVRRVLSIKVALGLFDDPFRRFDRERAATRVFTPAHLALAREVAGRCIVLLKNDGDLLPLARTGRRIALIGPFAEGRHDLVGPWTLFGHDAEAVDLASGVRAAVTDPSQIVTVKGSEIERPLSGGIEEAVTVAKRSDVVVLAIGEGQSMSGEAQSRTTLAIPAAQQALAEALARTGTPMVVVLKNGRALALEGAVLQAPAILVTWFLGSQTGHAIADVLFGARGPSARLPVSFPHASGQAPYYYARKRTGRPGNGLRREPFTTHYRDARHGARFPFGHGLTYGRIEYSDLDPGAAVLAWDGRLTLRATLTNRGRRAAEEVAQLYICDVASAVTRPVRELKGYQRVKLAPGASAQVTFTLQRKDLEFLGPNLKPTVEPGEFRVWIAPSAEAEGVSGTFVLAEADGS